MQLCSLCFVDFDCVRMLDRKCVLSIHCVYIENKFYAHVICSDVPSWWHLSTEWNHAHIILCDCRSRYTCRGTQQIHQLNKRTRNGHKSSDEQLQHSNQWINQNFVFQLNPIELFYAFANMCFVCISIYTWMWIPATQTSSNNKLQQHSLCTCPCPSPYQYKSDNICSFFLSLFHFAPLETNRGTCIQSESLWKRSIRTIYIYRQRRAIL